MTVGIARGVEPYTIDIDEEVLENLRRRLAATRWPDEIDDIGWAQGTNLAYLKDLVRYWRDEFDWRAHERQLNELPHYRTKVDSVDIHFVHERGSGPNPYPLVITHGWPSTFYEITKLIPLLTDPVAHGGDESDAFDVVVPSMPGFGFSERPRQQGVPPRVPELWLELMARLGYHRFGAHGGDIGGGVTARLGMYHPDRVEGIHVTNVYGSYNEGDQPLSEAEQTYLAEEERWDREEGAYGEIQATRPQTLSYGLNDSPAGLAAWIVEKYRNWSDCEGEVESVFSKDELLVNLTIYWATETINSSFRPYYESRHNPNPRPWSQISVPCGVAVFPKDLGRPPREWAERSYNVHQWTEMPRGGHFAAFEQPELLAEDIRRFFRRVR
jgi:pimeloyl-ACP methyl ester carboxylesterase